MISRNENGKLVLQSLDLEIFIGDLFEQCRTKHEVEWLNEQLEGVTELCYEEKLEELEELKEEN